MKLSHIAEALSLAWEGEDREITRITPAQDPAPDALTFAQEKRWLTPLPADAVVAIPDKLKPHLAGRSALITPVPALDLARAGELLGMVPFQSPADISPAGAIDPSAQLGANVRVGPGAVIGARVVIGDNSVIHAGAVIHADTVIGADCIIHSNAVIGADGFGYEFVDGRHLRIPHFGTVEIADDVEIGAGTTIDRGRFGPTRIGAGTRIDNLVQIGHNVQVGRHCLIISQAGVAGSCVLEDYAILAGQAGMAPHTRLGQGARVAAGSGIANDVPAGQTVSGWWAIPHRENLAQVTALRKLPDFMKRALKLMNRFEGE
ncbi:UDP-3-O-(3-hydroxymyristoyl)glucosamine N-acyltransferase [Magnetofaba australis]|uniref:Putative UDP-3-O-[3-hydroxymyristoyl] glucosamine N-acyltransferase n=1 Tax=Magnetofaba australis IT-1 TaxID=1434232 RepID=A0A1Y2K5C0_9PROT|nr:UDP-3-O-(3-hydroxymyristoyl)glucosamine N-acyltransferase [Magnetofaba australis]OSM02195.1 putative UDP-3-O-[3-hydroxymyristoyl] glucosamine N-acyltransferase [Magnetofaba australis IT-1]